MTSHPTRSLRHQRSKGYCTSYLRRAPLFLLHSVNRFVAQSMKKRKFPLTREFDPSLRSSLPAISSGISAHITVHLRRKTGEPFLPSMTFSASSCPPGNRNPSRNIHCAVPPFKTISSAQHAPQRPFGRARHILRSQRRHPKSYTSASTAVSIRLEAARAPQAEASISTIQQSWLRIKLHR